MKQCDCDECAGNRGREKARSQMEALRDENKKPESILEEAQPLVHGNRGDAYGHPLDDFSRTAQIWTAILGGKLAPGQQVEAEDVALCMVGVKISREVNKPRRDNRVDGAGYFETLEMVHAERERRDRGE